MGRQDAESETLIPTTGGGFDVAMPLRAGRQYSDMGDGQANVIPVAHALRGEGFDASEDGTGRGTPIVAIQGAATRENPSSGPDGIGVRTDGAAYTLEARQEVQAVMTLAIRGRSDGHNLEIREDGTANAILTPNGDRAAIGVGAVAFAQNQRDELREMDVAGSLAAEPGMKQQTYLRQSMAVRRLTPMECEALQGFPRNHTNITFRGKPAADGPRYKALGNSMACNVMNWVLRRVYDSAQVPA